MRKTSLRAAALCASLIIPAIAWANEPMSTRASNIDAADMKSNIAPALPVPPVGMDAGAHDYLVAAREALRHRRTGEAQQALEMAETRLLTRVTTPEAAATPDDESDVRSIAGARHALGAGDTGQAIQIVDGMISR